jgi:Ca-activated chloride channel family protein
LIWVDSSLLAVGAALTALVLVGLWAHQRRRRLLAEFLGGRTAMRRLSRLDLYRRGLRRALLLGTAGVALAVAAAEPRWEDAPPPPPPPLKQAVIAIDVSASMQAEDAAPTRLAQAVAVADSALSALEGHEVGLLVFAGTAYPLAPPTLDHRALRFLMSGLVPRLASAQDPGTLLSVAIDESLALLDRQPSETPGEAAPRVAPAAGLDGAAAASAGAASAAGGDDEAAALPRADGGRLIVIVSDGDTGEAEADVQAAVARAAESDIGLFAIGIGTEDGAGMMMPAGTYQLGGQVVDARGRPGTSRLRELVLRQVAAGGGGAYAHASAATDVRAMNVALADTGPAPEVVIDASTPVWARYDLPFLLGALALGLVLLESLVGMRLPVLRFLRARVAAS